MLDAKREILKRGRVHKLCLLDKAQLLQYTEVLSRWQQDEAFRSFFISLLSEAPFAAYRWETPPVKADTIDRVFEFVILDSPELDRIPPDPTPFSSFFAPAESEAGIVTFDNFGRDALLVAPSPRGPDSAYGHLAAFTRHAPESQNHALWQTVGSTMQDRICARPVWLSTAGGGVSWLHVRLDSRPKYYGFKPYTTHD